LPIAFKSRKTSKLQLTNAEKHQRRQQAKQIAGWKILGKIVWDFERRVLNIQNYPQTSKLPLKDTDSFHQLTCPFTLSPEMSSQNHNLRKIRNFHFKNYFILKITEKHYI